MKSLKTFMLKRISGCLFVLVLLLGPSSSASGQASESTELAQSRELNAKVIKLFSEGKYDEALPLARHALELREKALGPAHQDLLPILINLGEIYRARQQPDDARPRFERALTIAEKAFGEDDIRTAHLLDKLGYIARQRKDAEKFFLRSLQIKEKTPAPDNADTAKTIFNIAQIYSSGGDYQKAEPLYERVIRIYEKIPGKDSADLIRALQGYLATLHALKKTAQVDETQQRIATLLSAQGIIQGGVLNGKALKLARPTYPESARMDRAAGVVRVQIVIDENGKVIDAQAVNPRNVHLALVAAAEDAARRSLFTPTYLSGVRVKVAGLIIYNFAAQ